MKRAWLACATFALTACTTPAPPSTTHTTSVAASAPASAAPALPALPAPSSPFEPVVAPEALTPGALVEARLVGHTSVVLKLTDDAHRKFAYRPASRRSETRYRAELAASRLAVAWGLDEVPRAREAHFPCATLRALAHSSEIVCDAASDTTRGSITAWIPNLGFPALTAVRALAENEPARARAISRMVLFDDVIANWDRWSGGNIGEANGELVFLDNDAAFFEPAPPAALRAHRLFESATRMSRAFVDALRRTEPMLASIVGDDDSGAPLLTAAQVASARERARTALRIIDAKRARLGDDAVLAFP